MMRYLRLYLCFVRFSLSKGFEFRVDFLLHVIMEVAYAAVVVFFYEAIFLHVVQIGGWNVHQVRILYCSWIMIDALQTMIIGPNAENFPQLVNKGELDYYLTRPVSSLFFVSVREIAANAVFDVCLSAFLLGWSIWSYPLPLGALKITLFLFLLLNGLLIYYCIRFLMLLPIFWSNAADGLQTLFFSLHRFGERPDRIYFGWVRRIFTVMIPFCLIVSFPTRLLIDPFSVEIFLHLMVVTIGIFSLLLITWRKALRAYSSASS